MLRAYARYDYAVTMLTLAMRFDVAAMLITRALICHAAITIAMLPPPL